jgi:hypothetical protein
MNTEHLCLLAITYYSFGMLYFHCTSTKYWIVCASSYALVAVLQNISLRFHSDWGFHSVLPENGVVVTSDRTQLLPYLPIPTDIS